MHVRLARSSDADEIARIYRPFVESTIISFETVPPEPSEIADRIAATTVRYPWLVCERHNRIMGYAYATVGFRAVGVYRSVGYKLGAWHDVGWWELRLGSLASLPAAPVEMSAMQARSDWASLLAEGQSVIRDGSA